MFSLTFAILHINIFSLDNFLPIDRLLYSLSLSNKFIMPEGNKLKHFGIFLLILNEHFESFDRKLKIFKNFSPILILNKLPIKINPNQIRY